LLKKNTNKKLRYIVWQ